MVEIEKYKSIFGDDVEFKHIKSIFPTFLIFMDGIVGENEKMTKERKILALQQAKYCSQVEYQEYRIKNPKDTEFISLYFKYQHWIDDNLNSLTIFKKAKKESKKEKVSCFKTRDELLILFNTFKEIGIFHKDTQQKDYSIF